MRTLFVSVLYSISIGAIFQPSLPSILSKRLDFVDISCDGDHMDKILYNYSSRNPYTENPRHQSLEYEARDTIDGALTQNIRINGTGSCYDLVISMRCACYLKQN